MRLAVLEGLVEAKESPISCSRSLRCSAAMVGRRSRYLAARA